MIFAHREPVSLLLFWPFRLARLVLRFLFCSLDLTAGQRCFVVNLVNENQHKDGRQIQEVCVSVGFCGWMRGLQCIDARVSNSCHRDAAGHS